MTRYSTFTEYELIHESVNYEQVATEYIYKSTTSHDNELRSISIESHSFISQKRRDLTIKIIVLSNFELE